MKKRFGMVYFHLDMNTHEAMEHSSFECEKICLHR